MGMRQLSVCLQRQLTIIVILVAICALNALLVYVELLPSPTKWTARSPSINMSVFSAKETDRVAESKYRKEGVAVTNDSYMIYSVYWDRRPLNSTSPELMVLGVSRCRLANDTLPDAILETFESTSSKLVFDKTVDMDTDFCPDRYAPECMFVPTQMYGTVSEKWLTHLRMNEVDSEVIINVGANRNVTVRPVWSAETYDNTLSVCVPPLYWYHDWRRILIFMAMWRAQGAAHFYFYFNSGTKEVHKLLKYYERQGYATVLPYPDLPSTKEVDPNWSTYRLAHALAINDCSLRTKSKWAASVDIDEFFLMNDTNARLVDWLMRQPDNVAELSFTHRKLHFGAHLMGVLLTPGTKISPMEVGIGIAYPSDRSPKVIFQTRGIRSISTHGVARMQDGFRKIDVNASIAYYGHFRWDYLRSDAKNRTEQPILRMDLAEQVAKHIDQSKADVFGLDLPKYNGSAIDETTLTCSENWPSQKTRCMVPMRTCTKQMTPLAEWIVESGADTVYTIL